MTCAYEGCSRPNYTRGYCTTHYQRVLPTIGRVFVKGRSPLERFWEKVDKNAPNGCWVWTASGVRGGYGAFTVQGKRQREMAHRFAYKALVGPIPDSLTLDHICRNTSCVNPAHLEPVTIRVNTLRGVGPSALNAVKTHCKRGHPFAAWNIYRAGRSGGRMCKTCTLFRSTAVYEAKKFVRDAVNQGRLDGSDLFAVGKMLADYTAMLLGVLHEVQQGGK